MQKCASEVNWPWRVWRVGLKNAKPGVFVTGCLVFILKDCTIYLLFFQDLFVVFWFFGSGLVLPLILVCASRFYKDRSWECDLYMKKIKWRGVHFVTDLKFETYMSHLFLFFSFIMVNNETTLEILLISIKNLEKIQS